MAHEQRDTELQLLRVSNGAHRLTEMIDSLSTASNFDRQAKDVARELLRCAVDLQESLAMLRKLQDSSKQLAKMRKKNAAAVDSVDGSSRDCIEELRRVIRDSFQRHNVLTRSLEDDRILSSRSMRFNPSDEMNLSLKPLRTPTFDIHMPKVRKQQIMERSPDLQTKTPQDIIEKMQFKGILKSGQAEDLRIEPLTPNSSPLEQRYGSHCLDYDDEAPPIVIMKPLKAPSQERGEAHKDFHLQKNNAREETETVATGRTRIMEKPKACRKIVDRQKPLLTERKLKEKEVKVRRPAPLSQDKTSKQSHISAQVSALQKHKSNNPMKESTKNSASGKKKTLESESVKTSTIGTTVKDGKRSKGDGKAVKPLCQTAAISTSASSTMPANGETKQTEANQKPCSKEDYKALGEVLPKIISGERRSALAEETIQLNENKPTTREDLKRILLSSQPFLKHAQKFISPNGHQPIYRRKNIEAAGTKEAKLFLDSAIELMARKSQQKELARLSMFRSSVQAPKVYLSVDPLLLEISKGFEKLTTTYTAVNTDATHEDTLYAKLENDLKCKDMLINSMWDVGWSYCFCIEEAEQVVRIVGEDILFWLIEELAEEVLSLSYRS